MKILCFVDGDVFRTSVSVDVGFALGGPSVWDQQMFNRLHSTRNFAGCIQNVYLDTALLNLHVTTRAVGASNGCARTASPCEGVTACGANGRCRDAWDTYVCDCAYGFVGENCTEVWLCASVFAVWLWATVSVRYIVSTFIIYCGHLVFAPIYENVSEDALLCATWSFRPI